MCKTGGCAIQVHVRHREAEGLTDPEPCTGQHADEGGKGTRDGGNPQGPLCWAARDQRGDLRWGQQVGRRPTEGGDQPAGRDFCLREHGPQIGEKATRHTQTLGGATAATLG